ncbi:MAG TPA: hypothetical protein VN455_09125 [Methanotrichaceae archaeon]|nr:hypothetical protein [Methanotrichaceae archaeon]
MIFITIEAFDEAIYAWQNFYMLAGSAAATLLGLIFVATSLHIDIIAKAEKSADIRMMANWAFINFILILSFAFIFLIPEQNPIGIGVPLLILGAFELARTIRLWQKFGFMNKSKERIFETGQMRSSLLIPNTICYLALIYVASTIIQGDVSRLGWMVLVIIYLVISATSNSWSLMMRLAEIRAESKK